MFNNTFYPTPQEVTRKMLGLLDDKKLSDRKILEPSAGKGDILKVIPYKNNIKVIEIEPQLRAILKDEGYTVISSDFLDYGKDEIFDLIIMNPPFINGDQHLIHAWDILAYGDILCLLNAETINNPYTKTRTLLSKLIDDHGEVYSFDDCFREAERTTSVNIVCVHLKKDKMQHAFYFDNEKMNQDSDFIFNDYSDMNSQLATKDTIGNLVIDFEAAQGLMMQIIPLMNKLQKHAGNLGSYTKDFIEPLENFSRGFSSCSSENTYNDFIKILKSRAWQSVLELTGMKNLCTEQVRQSLDDLIGSNKKMAFNRANISELLETLFLSRNEILKECILEAFDLMTKYHEENRCHIEGWKTNSAWKVNKKIILPWILSRESYNLGDIAYRAECILNDIDRAMASLEGTTLDKLDNSIYNALKNAKKSSFSSYFTEKIDSSYFTIRAYKKGTIHLVFKDVKLWEKFNLTACKGKNWLPE